MTGLLLSAHVLAAIVLVGPIAVTASVFPRYLAAVGDEGADDPPALAAAAALHRITRGYAVVAVAVPLLGIVTASALSVLAEPWVLAALGVTVVAAGLLWLLVVPLQRAALDSAVEPGSTPEAAVLRRLRSATGSFNLAWAVVVVLMVLRPGSTTHV